MRRQHQMMLAHGIRATRRTLPTTYGSMQRGLTVATPYRPSRSGAAWLYRMDVDSGLHMFAPIGRIIADGLRQKRGIERPDQMIRHRYPMPAAGATAGRRGDDLLAQGRFAVFQPGDFGPDFGKLVNGGQVMHGILPDCPKSLAATH
jgi:hypothetical protein